MTKNLLTGLEHILYYKNPKALEALEAPLPKDKINSLFSELGFFDEDLYALYSWKNGCAFGKLVNPVFIFSTTILFITPIKLSYFASMKSSCLHLTTYFDVLTD